MKNNEVYKNIIKSFRFTLLNFVIKKQKEEIFCENKRNTRLTDPIDIDKLGNYLFCR